MSARAALARLGRAGRALETGMLVVLLAGMLGLATVQIVLRNGFDTGLVWADELLRILVLWLALVGGVAASRDDRHLAIDVLSRFLPRRPLQGARLVVYLFAASVTGILAWFSARFVYDSFRFEDTVLGQAPAWLFQLVMPVAFALMCYRFTVHAAGALLSLRRP